MTRKKATATAKCGGLSTTQQTMRLSVASVEMTIFLLGRRTNNGKSNGNPPGAFLDEACGGTDGAEDFVGDGFGDIGVVVGGDVVA
jgi:hypothetical protein